MHAWRSVGKEEGEHWSQPSHKIVCMAYW